MRLLFVSGVDAGGAPRSTQELAAALRLLGHDASVLLGHRPSRTSLTGRLERMVTKIEARRPGRPARRAFRWATRRTRDLTAPDGEIVVRRATFPENALPALLTRLLPDVVVVNSVSRSTFATISDDLRRAGIPLVLYLREAQSIKHLKEWGHEPRKVVANSEQLASEARAAGFECAVVPSAIDVQSCTVSSTRATLLMVNPVEQNRPELAMQIAAALPDLPVVLQESWDLSAEERARLQRRIGSLANVEVRPPTDVPAELYRDARVLLAPYPSGRPRVIVEAQHNEIPVIGVDQPALVEAAGDAGALIDEGAPLSEWVSAVERAWSDDRWYESLREACRAQAAGAETSPGRVAVAFEALMREVIG